MRLAITAAAILATLLPAVVVAPLPAAAQVVDYDAGVITIDGVQIFQDAAEPLKFYYLPRYPKLAQTGAGEFEILLVKVVGASDANFGGIFHALIEFELPDEVRQTVAEKLEEMRPGAELAGALPLYEPAEEDAYGSFRVVSATLSDTGEITNRLLTSGPAPLRSGTKAAIAARLSPEESTILMDSFTGTTSDISVSIRGYYEAKVKGYNAIVKADMDTVYAHRSIIDSFQKGYTRRQVRDIVDELVQDGAIQIDVYDRSEALGIETDDLESVLNLVTEKLTEVMFNSETGWSKVPELEEAVAQDQIKGRLEQGWFQKTFMNANDEPYYSDDQYVVKDRETIRSNSFYLNLSQSTTTRIPFDSSGNLGGFYSGLEEQDRESYFRVVVPGEDPARQSRDVMFQIDGEVAEGFGNTFNNVVVNVRKGGNDGEAAISKSLTFTPETIAQKNGLLSFLLYRQGAVSDDWTEFEYQTAWNLRGETGVLRSPAEEGKWLKSRDSAIALSPPLDREEIQFDVDTAEFRNLQIAAAEVQVATTLNGEVKIAASELVRASEASPSRSVVVFKDPGEDLAYRVIWHTRFGRFPGEFQLLDGSYAYVFAPTQQWLEDLIP